MQEKVTIRLYEGRHQKACCESARYLLDDKVKGWNYRRGDQIPLREKEGGFLMGDIDHVDPTVRQDATGKYKIATLWTLD